MAGSEVVELRGNLSLKIDYSQILIQSRSARKLLILLVGAGRFERPTPCAQDRNRRAIEMPYFQVLAFHIDTASLLNRVVPC
jgi:hypothetical protein